MAWQRWVSEEEYNQFHRPLKDVFVGRDGRFVIPGKARAMRAEDV